METVPDRPLHWYLMGYAHTRGFGRAWMGFDSKEVHIAPIRKMEQKIEKDDKLNNVVIMSVSYLGFYKKEDQ